MSSSARLTSSSGSSSSGSSSSAPLPLPLPQRSKPCTPSVCSTPPSLLSPLETLLQLGVPRERALKALVATGHRGVQIASDWLLSHVKDPSLDSKQPRHFVVYLCPVGKLLDQLQTFWDASHIQIGWNGAHNSFPHITLTSSFPCPDEQVEVLLEKVKKVCGDFQQDFDSGSFKLEKYVSPNFFGLFVGKKEEILLRSFSQELSQAFQSVGIDTEPMTKAYHVTLAYQFAPAHCAGLEDLVARVDPACSCDWQVRVYSFEERSKNHDVFKVSTKGEAAL